MRPLAEHGAVMVLLLGPVLLQACAGSTQRPTTPRTTELVVEDALIVEAAARGDDVGFMALPRLPKPLLEIGAPLVDAYPVALEALRAPGIPPRATGQSYELWLRQAFEPWLAATRAGLDRAVGGLADCAEAAEEQRVVASALTGLLWMRLIEQFNAVAAPDDVAGDEHLLQIYRHGLDRSTGPWLKLAVGPLQYCAQHASWLATGHAWLRMCQNQLNALTALQQTAIARAADVKRRGEQDRLRRIGPRPAGPEICWSPRIGAQATAARHEGAATHTAVVVLGEDGEGALSTQQQLALSDQVATRIIELTSSGGQQVEQLDAAKLAAAVRAQRQGRASVGGPRCKRPTDLADVLRASNAGLSLSLVERRCDGKRCALQVTLDPGLRSKAQPAWLRASGPDNADAMADLVKRLAPGLPMEPRSADHNAGPSAPERDLAYGRRDLNNGVRVSVRVPDHATIDASPLADATTVARLAACYARHIKPGTQPTIAVHAHVDITKTGKVRNAKLTPEPSDAAEKPSAALERCLVQALRQLAFVCPGAGLGAQATAMYCLKQDGQPTPPPGH